jgi:hypothetical protein
MSIDSFSKKGVKIILDDGKERTLRFTFGAFKLLSQTYGSVTKALKGFADQSALMEMGSDTIDLIINITHAGLRHEDRSLTADQVGDLITTENLALLIKAIGKALGYSMPEPDETANPPMPQ